jgi:hypothetical protein
MNRLGAGIKPFANHEILMVVLMGGLALVLVLMTIKAKDEAKDAKWLDEITALVKHHQEMAKFEGRERAYDPYLEQIGIVRMAYDTGDAAGTYAAMNRLMDMLQSDLKGGGIPTRSAKEIFDFCGKVTPAKYHDVSRHTQNQWFREWPPR